MPKSKRDKKVSLTKTTKHGKDWKKKLIEEVRKSAQDYASIFVFRVLNMRISALNELRKKLRDDSKLFLGKNKVIQVAIGKSPESEIFENIHLISGRLVGDCGLLFTDKTEAEVMEIFESFTQMDFARSGARAIDTVELEEGPMEQFSHALEPHLRSLGLPTSLKKGVVTLVKAHTVCKKGQVLTPEQAKILKLLDIKMAPFKILVDSIWTKPDHFKVLLKFDESSAEEEIDEDEQETIVEDEEEDMDDEVADGDE